MFKMTQAERDEMGIKNLPGNLKEALQVMEADGLAKATLGEHVYNAFVSCKNAEWDSFRTYVSQWEIDEYICQY